MVMHHRNKSVNVHQFAMVPRADIPRAAFTMQQTHKTTFDSGLLIPVLCEEILPGDQLKLKMTAFARLSTPIFPVMDNMYLDSFFFFVPNRLIWEHWREMNGQQDSPGASTDYLVPQVVSAAGGFPVNSIYDYFGLPTVGQVDVGATVSVNALPLRAYNLIFNEWFRDENLINPSDQPFGDGPDSQSQFGLRRRGKRHDYFTSCLPWPQKGPAVPLPLSGDVPVYAGSNQPFVLYRGGVSTTFTAATPAGSNVTTVAATAGSGALNWGPLGTPTGLFADLSQATAATINELRQAFQIQKLLERDARGGTRYIEVIRAHFGVTSPDARQQRPEYLGGGSAPIVINPVVQNSGSNITGQTTPQGNLAATGTMLAHGHGFSQSFTEHGYVIGLVSVRADLTYQQGLRRHWSRRTRFDYYWPAFAMLGEQAVLEKEIYCTGNASQDNSVFGYQERWAEYRYAPSQITGLFRSTSAGTLDAWHLAQRFTTAPGLNIQFIEENPPLSRVLAVGSEANGAQLIFDSFFDMRFVRPMPLYSVPGLIDHF